MPVGFENSALKMSFSLSSLEPSSGNLESPEQVRVQAERPYNSLTKKPRKDPEQEMWRRSWGNREENKDDFWAALQSNYNYLMDNNLIESCKEASGELSWDEDVTTENIWTYKEFVNQFSELYSWLNSIQEAVYGTEENVIDRNLRVSHVEEMQRKGYRRKLFNEQSNKLVRRYPDVRDEVAWRMAHLNSKWEMLEQAITPAKNNPAQLNVCADVDHEVKCLKKWIREMEGRLQPLDLRVGIEWNLQELEEKAREHMVVHRDVHSHSKIVNSVVKLCEKLTRSEPATLGLNIRYDTAHTQKIAKGLELRWQYLFLRSLEWQTHLENLAAKLKNSKPAVALVSDSDEEPVSKFPRLSESSTGADHLTDDGSYFEDDISDLCVMDTSPPPGDSSVHTAAEIKEDKVFSEEAQTSKDMVGPSPKPRQKKHNTDAYKMGTTTTDHNDNHCDVPQENTRRKNKSPLGQRRLSEDISKFNKSNRKAPNCATFYFRHLDTDSEHDAVSRAAAESLNAEQIASAANLELKSVDDSSDEEWTFSRGNSSPLRANGRSDGSGSSSETASSIRRQVGSKKGLVVVRLDFGDGLENNNEVSDFAKGEESSGGEQKKQRHPGRKEAIQRLVSQAEEMVREEPSPDKTAAARAARVFEPLVFGEIGKVSSNSQAKYARIKQWLKVHLKDDMDGKPLLQPVDSCDASGEYTTGDSDEEKESQSSEELNGSITTCRQLELLVGGLGSSAEAILDTDSTPVAERSLPLSPEHSSSSSKVVLRTKRRQMAGERPWSVSGISQLGSASHLRGNREPLAHFSNSESALHKMLTTPPGRKSVSGANLSSSTVEDTPQLPAEGSGSRSGSLRRRKVRLRKRTLGRKSESGSDGMTAGHSGGSDTQHHSRSSSFKLSPSSGAEGSSANLRSPTKSHQSSGAEGSPLATPHTLTKSRSGSSVEAAIKGSLTRTLVKSGSFSGTPAERRRVPERYVASEPVMLAYSLTHTSDITTGTETDDEKLSMKQGPVPMFKLGPVAGAVTVRREGSSDVEKSSILGAEEQLSSFSEQAWDNYQEKYMSEPYSEEMADSETARRLLEFGEDYRNFLDSQSDCASSLSANHVSSPVRRRRQTMMAGDSSLLDSDSDLEDIRHIIQQSHSQLVFTENVFSKQLAKASPEVLLSTDYAEIVATCRENIRCLRVIVNNVEEEGGLLSAQECREIRGLVERWDMVQVRAEDLQRVRALQREMAALRNELLNLAARVTTMECELQDRDQLEARIHQVKSELAALRERKTELLRVNVAVHRFLTDTGHPAALLKDEVADLYRVWEETFQGVSQQLSNLQRVSQAWQQFEVHLSELQCALRADHNTLRMLDSALQGGDVSQDVATSVRDVAKVLSEKPDTDSDETIHTQVGDTSSLIRNTEGSLSDSGISDSGSEQELSEREKRLAALRRLARHLEAVLAPGSAALVNMAKRIEQTESELRGLQQACRDLILRTAVCVEARQTQTVTSPAPGSGQRRTSTVSRRKKSHSKSEQCTFLAVAPGDPDDDPEPGKSRPWLWRVMRAALPFQMALVALFCVACLLEPHCCDAMNSLNLSLSPQLRYVRGPPPI